MAPEIDKQKWQTNYRETHELLEHMRARELASLTDEEAWGIIQSLVACGAGGREKTEWSGLIVQQALFHRKKRD